MKRGVLRAGWFVAGVGLFAAAAALAQGAQQEPAPIERPSGGQAPTIHVETRLVNVALNVTDEHGAPVGGLTVNDFEIAEDGKPQKIAIFDREATTPLEIVLAIDASESTLSDEPLERQAAKKFVQSILRPQDAIDLMDFADDVDELVSFTNDARRIDNGLGRIQHGDATALYDAVYLASERLAETPQSHGERRVLVMITDGENTTHHGSYDAALEQAQKTGTMIYSLIIVPVAADAGRDTGGEHALIQMSKDTGGKYYFVEEKRDLADALAHVSDDLRTQYSLGYYAPQRGGDSRGLRQIRLQMKDPALRGKYTLRYRTAYYATRP
jgi:Ca-activated chloride channel homolog